MSTEERLNELERRLLIVQESHRSYDQFILRQLRHNEEFNENLAILLGVARSQGQDIKTMQTDIAALKEDVGTMQVDIAAMKERLVSVEGRLERVESRLDTVAAQVLHGFTSVNERLDAIMALLGGNPRPEP